MGARHEHPWHLGTALFSRYGLHVNCPSNMLSPARTTILVVLGGAALLIVAAIAFIQSGYRPVEIVNRSNVAIDSLIIVAASQDVFRGTLAPGSRVKTHFWATHDTSYTVSARFADGTTVQASIGYVDMASISRDVLELEPGLVRLNGSISAADRSLPATPPDSNRFTFDRDGRLVPLDVTTTHTEI